MQQDLTNHSSTIQPSSQTAPTVTIALNVTNMRCAGCVQAVEKRLRQQTGVIDAVVNLVTEMAMVEYEPERIAPEHLITILGQSGFPSQVQNLQTPILAEDELREDRKVLIGYICRLAIATTLIVLSGLGHLGQIPGLHLPGLAQGWLHNFWLHWGLATLALLGPGRPILVEGWQGLWRGIPNMNTLVGLGTLSAYTASLIALLLPQLQWECFFDEPVMILGFILLGRTLEQQAKDRAKASFRALLSLQPLIARWLPKLDHPRSVEIPVQQVQVGAWLNVLPGDRFPVDGEIISGQTLVDESMFTGEPLTVARGVGDPVLGGSLNQGTAVTIAATRTGKDTALAQIIALVETAQTRKAPIQRVADGVAGYFTYGVMAIALLTFLFWYFLGSHWFALDIITTHLSPAHLHQVPAINPLSDAASSISSPLLLSLKLAIAVLVVACPCALGLATPTAILVGTSLGAEQGLLIRGADVLEEVQRLDTILFDKTGTLTSGQPTVQDCWLASSVAADWTATQLLQLAASVEVGVQHPLSLAIQTAAEVENVPLLEGQNWSMAPGLGVGATIAGQQVHLGTHSWLEQQGITIPIPDQQRANQLAQAGKTVVYVAVDGIFIGGIAAQDTLRSHSASTVQELQSLGLEVMVVTGDQQATATAILEPLGLPATAILSQMTPLAKADLIAQLQAQGRRVGMVGDGINDAPALAQANVGIALATGTDVAVETAQIVLMPNRRSNHQGTMQLQDVVAALHLSQRTWRKIHQNLFWACAYNLIGIPIAAGALLPGWGIVLSPALAGAMMAFSSVCVVTNSLLLRWEWQDRER